MESGPLLPDDEASIKGTRDWPHAPPHRLQNPGVFFLTSRARAGAPLLMEDDMKDWFQDRLFTLAADYGWKLEAWAIFSNHYHLIGHSPEKGGQTLKQMVTALHSLSTKERNRRDGTPGRNRLWHNYRETALTHQKSYLARLHYAHQNAVHHWLVRIGSQWKWCSASAFKAAVSPAWVRRSRASTTARSRRGMGITKDDGGSFRWEAWGGSTSRVGRGVQGKMIG